MWGASGGDTIGKIGGLGGYTAGNISLDKGQKLYVYVGSKGGDAKEWNVGTAGGWNGGATAASSTYEIGGNTFGTGGGGETDIRLVSTTSENIWNEFNSLKSRIMVAGGGGGSVSGSSNISTNGGLKTFQGNRDGGSAGGLIGYNGIDNDATGGSQISGGNNSLGDTFGGFGYANSTVNGINPGGGGGGYYGGGTAHTLHGFNGGYRSGGGGSSFISGHSGCDAIKEESTDNNIIHTDQSIHYSGYRFIDTEMIDGNGYNWTNVKGEYTEMPSHDGKSTIVGNSGNGYARITLIEKK